MADRLDRPPLGCDAPAIDLPTLDGDRWHLADRAGRTVVLVFHRHIH